MIRLFAVLFLGISMTCGSAEALRERGDSKRTQSRSSKKSTAKSSRSASARRGRSGVRTATLVAPKKIDIEEKDEIIFSEKPEIVDALTEKVNQIKKEINAVEQCVMTLCDAGTDSEETTMALCSNDYKKKKLAKREKELREKEDKVRLALGGIQRQKLTSSERKLYDSIKTPEKEEDNFDDSMNFDDLMADIEDMSDSLDTEGTKRRITGDVLLLKAVEMCAKKFPNEVDNKDNFIALMTVRADNSANALSEYYDKKAYKLEVAFDTAMKKVRMTAVNANRDALDTDTCVNTLLTKAQGIYGTNFSELAKCDDLTSGCADRNFAQFEDSKKAFSTTLDSCKDGNGAWEIALMKIKRTLDQSAKSEIFDSKSEAIEELADVQNTCKLDMTACIEGVCGGSDAGNIFCYSGNDPFVGENSSSLSLYKKKDTEKVNDVFAKMNKEYGIELKQVSLKDAKASCAIKIEDCERKIALLSEDPELSKEMLDTNLDAMDLFKRAFIEIQVKADRDFTKHEGKILTTQLSAIKTRLNTRTELITSELTNETALAKLKLDEARAKDKNILEDNALRSENIKELTKRKLDAETGLIKVKSASKSKRVNIAQEGKVNILQAERDVFYKIFCNQYAGSYDGNARVCSFPVSATRNKKNSWDTTISVSPIQGATLKCSKGAHGFTKKPKACTFSNGNSIKKNKECSIPSFDEMYQSAKNGNKIEGTCFGTLDLGSAFQETISKAKLAD